MYEEYGDDPELAYAMKLSMMEQEAAALDVPDEPPEGADPSTIVSLQIRMPDGSKLQRRFARENKIQDIVNYIKK